MSDEKLVLGKKIFFKYISYNIIASIFGRKIKKNYDAEKKTNYF